MIITKTKYFDQPFENLSSISKLENSRSLNVSNSFWVILKTLLHSVIELNVTIFIFYQTKIFLKFSKFMNFFSISKFYLQSPNSFSFYRHLQCLNLIWVRRSKNRIVNGWFYHIYTINNFIWIRSSSTLQILLTLANSSIVTEIIP